VGQRPSISGSSPHREAAQWEHLLTGRKGVKSRSWGGAALAPPAPPSAAAPPRGGGGCDTAAAATECTAPARFATADSSSSAACPGASSVATSPFTETPAEGAPFPDFRAPPALSPLGRLASTPLPGAARWPSSPPMAHSVEMRGVEQSSRMLALRKRKTRQRHGPAPTHTCSKRCLNCTLKS
jgi:hypothetical protein